MHRTEGNPGNISTISLEEIRAVASLLQALQGVDPPQVVVLSGAGTSVASGIPDFRSPGGMYDTLRPTLLTATSKDRAIMAQDPTHVVSRSLFMRNPLPYHEVRRPFIVGSATKHWKPTLCHAFYRLLHNYGHLRRLYTQNIDGLDFDVGLPRDKIICVHGSIREVICEACERDPYDSDFDAYVTDVRANIRDIYGKDGAAPKVSIPISCRLCGKQTVKPSTTLYGSSMPDEFLEAYESDFGVRSEIQLLLVIGSSLTVYPAAGIPESVPKNCQRVLLNREETGSFDFSSNRDLFLQGDCDEVILALIAELGWINELVEYSPQLCEKSRSRIAQNKH